MEVGLYIKSGKLVPGRRKGDKTSVRDGQTGFFIVKRPTGKVFRVMESDPWKFLTDKASYVVDHFAIDVLTVGGGSASRSLGRSRCGRNWG